MFSSGQTNIFKITGNILAKKRQILNSNYGQLNWLLLTWMGRGNYLSVDSEISKSLVRLSNFKPEISFFNKVAWRPNLHFIAET